MRSALAWPTAAHADRRNNPGVPMLAELAGFLQIEPWPPVLEAPFWAALALVGGGLLGEAVHWLLGLARILGYGGAGMLLALAGLGLGDAGLHGTARLIVDLALALLLFELGSRVRLHWLRANPALLLTCLAETGLSFAAIVFVLRWIGLDLNIALSCAALTVSTSAAVVGRVAGELRAAGQVTERMIVLTALNTLLAVLAYKLVSGWLHVDQAGDWARALAQPLYTLVGSVLLAALLARLVASAARRLDLRDENAALLLLGMIVLALMVAKIANLSTLLVPLLAGALLRNMSERPWVWPRHFGTAGGVLMLMLFVIVGSAWTPALVVLGGAAALALLAARLLAKALAVGVLARWSGIAPRQGAALALALTPISGTSLVLLADLQAAHPAFAAAVVPIVLSAIFFTELLGPLAVQAGLRWAGELPPRAVGTAPPAAATRGAGVSR